METRKSRRKKVPVNGAFFARRRCGGVEVFGGKVPFPGTFARSGKVPEGYQKPRRKKIPKNGTFFRSKTRGGTAVARRKVASRGTFRRSGTRPPGPRLEGGLPRLVGGFPNPPKFRLVWKVGYLFWRVRYKILRILGYFRTGESLGGPRTPQKKSTKRWYFISLEDPSRYRGRARRKVARSGTFRRAKGNAQSSLALVWKVHYLVWQSPFLMRPIFRL